MTTIIPGNPWFLETLQSATYFDRTTIEWVNANTMVEYTVQAQQTNRNRIAEYNVQFDKYADTMDKTPAQVSLHEPVVPNSQGVQLSNDGTPIVVETTRPVCAKRVYTPPVITPMHGIAATSDPLQLFLANAQVGEWFNYGGKLFTRTS